ncbi:hypothetical protein RJT34_33398 [Clitoria ternatea]|uniref:WRKY domain-containing protein n=1 Tax=Clitoria ternatea TaxID=43366 RepID=A0AAN9EZV5_CLITE
MELASERSGDGGSGLKEDYSVGNHKQDTILEVEEQLESTKAEMGEVREENERLKMRLNEMMSEYRTLEMQFEGIVKEGRKRKYEEIVEECDLVSLRLGRVPSRNDDKIIKLKEEGLTLGLDCKFETANSCEQLPKTKLDEDPAKKPRVCMNDGCQWRKYGQKISKGNPCPRAYYRCTVAQSCPVRKQVQRCAQDRSVLITTYEGTHNHNLPPSATAMASTTSAAASMLLSGSSHSASSITTTPAGLNLYLSHASNPSLSSSSPSHPTITLDLTSNSALSSPFYRFTNQPRYPSSSNLSFNSSQPNNWTLNYNPPQPYNHILTSSTLNFGRQQIMENMYSNPTLNNPTNSTVSAATKVITEDPTFQSALAAALTSFIGSSGNQTNVVGNLSQKMKWGELFPASNSNNLLNKTPANAPQNKSFMFSPPPSLPFSTPKSASASPAQNSHTTD